MSKSTNIPQNKDESMYPGSHPANTPQLSESQMVPSNADVARMAHNDDSRCVTSSDYVAVSYSPSRNGAPRHADRDVQVSPRVGVALVLVVLTSSRSPQPPVSADDAQGSSSPPGERNVTTTRADQVGRTISVYPTAKPLLVSRPPEDRPRTDLIKRTISAKATTQPPLASGPPVDRPGVSTSLSLPGERSVDRPRADQIKRTVSAKATTQPPLASGPPVDRPGVSPSPSPPGERNVDRPRADQIKRTIPAQPITQPPMTSEPPEDRSGTSASLSLPDERNVNRTRAD